MNLGLRGKVALVTAASRGLGRACAQALAEEGARVAICSRSLERISSAASEISQETGNEVKAFAADVTKPEDIYRLISEVKNSFGRLDVLVSNTGSPPPGDFCAIEREQWQCGLDLCLWPAIYLCRAVIPEMQKQHWGRIIFLSSSFAKDPDANFIVSSTIRAGLLNMAKCLARDLAPSRITVNTVMPGYIDTPLLREFAEVSTELSQASSQSLYDAWAQMIPAGRLGNAMELAQAVAFLASDSSAYITGSAIGLDGGLIHSV